MVTLVGGTFLGNWVAGRKNSNDDKQAIIDQLQEERNYTNTQLQLRDTRIDALYETVNNLKTDLQKALHENRVLTWELDKEVAKNKILTEENTKLKSIIKDLREKLKTFKGGK